ncbi:MAG: hypothetical protein WCO55_03900 [Candidatus Falkowbacteria bacterium]
MRRRIAFSLIETIVIIALVAALAIIATAMFRQNQSRTRDLQRVHDIKNLQEALEIYHQKVGVYPNTLTAGHPLITPGGEIIAAKIPVNPKPADCRISNYSYKSLDGGLSYNLVFCLANSYADISPGRCVADPSNFCNSLGEGCLSENCVWQYVGQQGITDGEADSASLLLNKFAKLYLSFRDSEAGGKANVMAYDLRNNGGWTDVQAASVLALQQGQAAYPVLAVHDHDNSNKNIYLALSDLGAGGKAKVLINDYTSNDVWRALSNGLFSTAVKDLSLIVDKKIAYLAFQDVAQDGKATVMVNDNLGSWSALGSRGFSTGVASQISLQMGSTLYITYLDESLDKVVVKKNSGNSWVNVGSSQTISNGNASNLSLAIYGNQPCVGYIDYNIGHKATVMCYNGSSWNALGGSGFSAGQADNTTLLSHGNNLYISYLDKYNDNKATVMQWDGAQWQPLGPAGFSPSDTGDPSMANLDNNLYIAFTDPTKGGKISVMGYQ